MRVAVKSAIVFGLVTGATIATVVTVVVCSVEWVQNPGGIFRGEQGTNWQFVGETALSWIVPGFLYSAGLLTLLHGAWTGVSVVLRKRSAR